MGRFRDSFVIFSVWMLGPIKMNIGAVSSLSEATLFINIASRANKKEESQHKECHQLLLLDNTHC